MSTVTVRIPMPPRSYTLGADEIAVEADTVRQAIEVLGARHEGILDRVLDTSGELRQFVNIFVGARNIQAIEGLATQLAKGDVISIIPAVAGGDIMTAHDRRLAELKRAIPEFAMRAARSISPPSFRKPIPASRDSSRSDIRGTSCPQFLTSCLSMNAYP